MAIVHDAQTCVCHNLRGVIDCGEVCFGMGNLVVKGMSVHLLSQHQLANLNGSTSCCHNFCAVSCKLWCEITMEFPTRLKHKELLDKRAKSECSSRKILS